jgi:acylpyruvate hydrolase
MKIICVGRNYAEHAAELQNDKPTEPVIFLKPDTALLKNNQPFYHPNFSKEIHYECEVVVRICREGKHIEPKFSHKYFDQIGLGVDFTARDLQNDLKSKGLPWELSKSFDNSAVISSFISTEEFEEVNNLHFKLFQNNIEKQSCNTSEMIFNIDQIISFVSKYITVKTGDYIFTGTPKGVGKISIGDVIEGYLEDRKMFEFEVK